MRRWVVAAGLVVLVVANGCSNGGRDTTPAPEAPMTIELTSSAFADGAAIPRRFTCDGDDVSPPLAWKGLPTGTVELALLVEDPDAPRGTFVHWILWGVDPANEGISEADALAGTGSGRNGFGHERYGGPCPPRGDAPHHYVFTLFALSQPLSLERGASVAAFKRALDGRLLAQGQLIGTYGR